MNVVAKVIIVAFGGLSRARVHVIRYLVTRTECGDFQERGDVPAQLVFGGMLRGKNTKLFY